MVDANGQLLDIDVTDDIAFRSKVVQTLQHISDQTKPISSMKETLENHEEILKDYPKVKAKVERHDDYVRAGRLAAIPAIGVLHICMRWLLAKLGW